jgi:hypothetical protein
VPHILQEGSGLVVSWVSCHQLLATVDVHFANVYCEVLYAQQVRTLYNDACCYVHVRNDCCVSATVLDVVATTKMKGCALR